MNKSNYQKAIEFKEQCMDYMRSHLKSDSDWRYVINGGEGAQNVNQINGCLIRIDTNTLKEMSSITCKKTKRSAFFHGVKIDEERNQSLIITRRAIEMIIDKRSIFCPMIWVLNEDAVIQVGYGNPASFYGR